MLTGIRIVGEVAVIVVSWSMLINDAVSEFYKCGVLTAFKKLVNELTHLYYSIVKKGFMTILECVPGKMLGERLLAPCHLD